MSNSSKHTPLHCPQQGRFLGTPTFITRKHPVWRAGFLKDFLAWGAVLATVLLTLMAWWTPLMQAPLSEMTQAFMQLHQGQ